MNGSLRVSSEHVINEGKIGTVIMMMQLRVRDSEQVSTSGKNRKG